MHLQWLKPDIDFAGFCGSTKVLPLLQTRMDTVLQQPLKFIPFQLSHYCFFFHSSYETRAMVMKASRVRT